MVAVALMWSTAGVITRHLEFARSFEVTFWRAFFTAASLAVALPFLRGRDVFFRIRTAGLFFWLSGVCWGVMFTTFMLALTLTSVGNVLVTMSIGPLLTALMARAFIGHLVANRTWVAIIVAAVGIVYMYASQMSDVTLLALTQYIAPFHQIHLNNGASYNGKPEVYVFVNGLTPEALRLRVRNNDYKTLEDAYSGSYQECKNANLGHQHSYASASLSPILVNIQTLQTSLLVDANLILLKKSSCQISFQNYFVTFYIQPASFSQS